MPKAKISDAEALARFEKGLDAETTTLRDRSATAEIRAAVDMRDHAQDMIDVAVADARKRGPYMDRDRGRARRFPAGRSAASSQSSPDLPR